MSIVRSDKTRFFVIILSFLALQLASRFGYSDESEPVKDGPPAAEAAKVESPQFIQLKAFLEGSREELGRPAHWIDLYRFANKNGINVFKSIKPEETGAIVDAMKAAHKTLVVTKEELFSILKAQRQAIRSWQSTAHIQREYSINSIMSRLPEDQTSHFAVADGRFLMETNRPAAQEDMNGYDLVTFSEGVQRHLGPKPQGKLALKLKQPATIEKMTQDPTLSFYFQPGNIIAEAMLFDSEPVGLPREAGPVDIMQSEPIGFVLEGEHNIAGDRCVCLMTPISSFYFDIKRGFALRKVERLPRMHVTDPEFSQENSDLKDCGEGIWLPSKVVKTWHSAREAGVAELKEQLEYSKVSINEPLPEKEFTDIIPAGAIVSDFTKDLCYVAGEKGEIAKLISSATPSAEIAPLKRGLARWGILAANLAIIAGVVAFAVSRRPRARHT